MPLQRTQLVASTSPRQNNHGASRLGICNGKPNGRISCNALYTAGQDGCRAARARAC